MILTSVEEPGAVMAALETVLSPFDERPKAETDRHPDSLASVASALAAAVTPVIAGKIGEGLPTALGQHAIRRWRRGSGRSARRPCAPAPGSTAAPIS